MSSNQYIPSVFRGVVCHVAGCNQQARHKVEEINPFIPGIQQERKLYTEFNAKHPYSAYLCTEHFDLIMHGHMASPSQNTVNLPHHEHKSGILRIYVFAEHNEKYFIVTTDPTIKSDYTFYSVFEMDEDGSVESQAKVIEFKEKIADFVIELALGLRYTVIITPPNLITINFKLP